MTPASLNYLAHPWALALYAAVPVLGLLGFFARRRRRLALERLGSWPALLALATVSPWRRALRSACFSCALFALILATAGPRWGYEPTPATAAGRDLVV